MSEAIGAEIEALGVELGHRTLAIVRKGGKTVTVPPRPAPPAQLTRPSANGPPGRSSPPRDGRRLDRHGRLVSSAASPAGPCAVKPIGPHVSSRDKDAEILVLRHQLSIRSLNRRGNALSLPSRQLRSDRLVPSVSLLFC